MDQVDVYEREREKTEECQHEWDIEDLDEEDSMAIEYCKKCGEIKK